MSESKILKGFEVLPPLESKAEEARKRLGRTIRNRPTSKKRTGRRFAMLNNFIDFSMRKLGRSDVTVWFVLFRDAKDGVSHTGQKDIARRAGLSDRTVRRALDRLGNSGLLDVVKRGGLNRGVSSYRLRAIPDD
jgi:DNA-binding transcriptional ArsR family regulator